MRRPRIVLVGPAPHGPVVGGLQKFAALHVDSMLRERFECVVFDSNREGRRGGRVLGALGFAALAARFAWLVAVRRPRVAHVLSVSGTHFYQAATLSTLALVAGCRVVFHIHGGGFETFYRSQRPWLRRLSDRFLRAVDAILCTSSEWDGRLRRLCPGIEPMVLPNAIDWSAFAASRAARSSQPERLTVLFIGAIHADLNRAKGLGELLAAGRELERAGEGVRLLLAGLDLENDDEARAIVAFGAETAGPVETFGVVDEAEKMRLFGECDVFVLPSHVENFPITVLEAMSAGRAVVASRVGGVPDQIEDGVGGLLVPPRDPGALAAAVGRLGRDPVLRERMGALNARRARERYDSPVVFGRLAALYDRLLGADRPDARPAWSAEGEVR